MSDASANPELPRGMVSRMTSCAGSDDGLADMPPSPCLSAGVRQSRTARCGPEDVRAARMPIIAKPAEAVPRGYLSTSRFSRGPIGAGLVGESAVDSIESPHA